MNYKIYRVIFNHGTGVEEYNIPTGWEVNQVIFATDTQAVFVLRQIQCDVAVLAPVGYDYVQPTRLR